MRRWMRRAALVSGVAVLEAWDDNNDDLIDQDEYRGRAA